MKKYICLNCNKEFETRSRGKNRVIKFCSIKCSGEYAKKQNIRYCKYCGKIIETKNNKTKNKLYCSRECKDKSRQNTNLSEEWKNNISEARKNSIKCRGSNLYNWKGGIENTRRKNKERYYQKKAKGKINFDYLNILYKLQKGKCFYCGCDLKDYKAIEHVTPIYLGGDNKELNLVYSCKSCNSKKHNKPFWQFCLEINKPYLMNNLIQIKAKEIYDYQMAHRKKED